MAYTLENQNSGLAVNIWVASIDITPNGNFPLADLVIADVAQVGGIDDITYDNYATNGYNLSFLTLFKDVIISTGVVGAAPPLLHSDTQSLTMNTPDAQTINDSVTGPSPTPLVDGVFGEWNGNFGSSGNAEYPSRSSFTAISEGDSYQNGKFVYSNTYFTQQDSKYYWGLYFQGNYDNGGGMEQWVLAGYFKPFGKTPEGKYYFEYTDYDSLQPTSVSLFYA